MRTEMVDTLKVLGAVMMAAVSTECGGKMPRTSIYLLVDQDITKENALVSLGEKYGLLKATPTMVTLTKKGWERGNELNRLVEQRKRAK